MAETPDDHHEKEGVSMADVVKALVLAWSAALLTASYLGIFPQMKMGQYVCGFAANRGYGVVWYRAQDQWKWQ